MERSDIFAETVQIKRFLYLEETPNGSCFVCSRVLAGFENRFHGLKGLIEALARVRNALSSAGLRAAEA